MDAAQSACNASVILQDCAQNQVEGAEETALALAELLRATEARVYGLGYSIPHAAAARRGGTTQRTREEPRQTGQYGIQTLRQHVPNGAANKKMSKVETLRSAVEYIHALQQLWTRHDAISAAFQCGVPSPTLSNAYSADPESPHSSYSSDEGSFLSSEDQELLDFHNVVLIATDEIYDPHPNVPSCDCWKTQIMERGCWFGGLLLVQDDLETSNCVANKPGLL